MARNYPLKRGFSPDPARIQSVLGECFGVPVESQGGKLSLRYGTFARLTVWLEGKSLCVESQPAAGQDKEVVRETIRRFNDFLRRATGYTSKERRSQLTKETSE